MMFTLIEYMPVHLRSSHLAAGNSGTYPHNGAVRVLVEGEVDPSILDPDWTSVVRTGFSDEEDWDIFDSVPTEALATIEEE
jgi:hypothetical protein